MDVRYAFSDYRIKLIASSRRFLR